MYNIGRGRNISTFFFLEEIIMGDLGNGGNERYGPSGGVVRADDYSKDKLEIFDKMVDEIEKEAEGLSEKVVEQLAFSVLKKLKDDIEYYKMNNYAVEIKVGRTDSEDEIIEDDDSLSWSIAMLTAEKAYDLYEATSNFLNDKAEGMREWEKEKTD
jgi:hypothetical protein